MGLADLFEGCLARVIAVDGAVAATGFPTSMGGRAGISGTGDWYYLLHSMAGRQRGMPQSLGLIQQRIYRTFG